MYTDIKKTDPSIRDPIKNTKWFISNLCTYIKVFFCSMQKCWPLFFVDPFDVYFIWFIFSIQFCVLFFFPSNTKRRIEKEIKLIGRKNKIHIQYISGCRYFCVYTEKKIFEKKIQIDFLRKYLMAVMERDDFFIQWLYWAGEWMCVLCNKFVYKLRTYNVILFDSQKLKDVVNKKGR